MTPITLFKVFSSILLISCIILVGNSPALAQESIGQVVWVKGTLKATQPSAPERNLTRRSPIFEQDTLTTDASSTGQVVFTDNSVLALKEGTTLELTKYKYTKGAAPAEETFVTNLAKGGFRTITGAITKDNPNGYKANTPVATIGVSGTQYIVFYNPTNNKLDATVTSGKVTITNAAGTQTISSYCGKQALCFKAATVNGKDQAPKGTNKVPETLKNFPTLTSTSSITGVPSVPGITTTTTTTTTTPTGTTSTTTGGTTSTGTGSDFSINQPCN